MALQETKRKMKRYIRFAIHIVILCAWWALALTMCEAFSGGSYTENTSTQTEDSAICKLSATQATLPIQISKVRVPSISLTARHNTKYISITIFGRPANSNLTKAIETYIYHSCNIKPALPTFSISFPFSAFW